MNNLEIIEGGYYKIQDKIGDFTSDLYIIKKVNIRQWFKIVPGIVYSNFETLDCKQIMSVDKFNKIALYQVK